MYVYHCVKKRNRQNNPTYDEVLVGSILGA